MNIQYSITNVQGKEKDKKDVNRLSERADMESARTGGEERVKGERKCKG